MTLHPSQLGNSVTVDTDELETLLARSVWGGHELSGGQWQRLACARAMYRQPAVLVLDEPTSEMDARGEHQIFRELRAMAPDRIAVVVTHRLDNVRMADRVIVLDQGAVREQGSFDELVAGKHAAHLVREHGATVDAVEASTGQHARAVARYGDLPSPAARPAQRPQAEGSSPSPCCTPTPRPRPLVEPRPAHVSRTPGQLDGLPRCLQERRSGTAPCPALLSVEISLRRLTAWGRCPCCACRGRR